MNQLSKLAPVGMPPAEQRPSLAVQVELAARTVPPLWPLDGAIAVNPLAGFEDMPFEQAVRAAAARFRANSTLAIDDWRRLCENGKLDKHQVRMAAIQRLGGFERAFEILGPDLNLIDCLMARLFDLAPPATPVRTNDPSATLVAGWCAAYFDEGTSTMAMPGRGKGLFAAARALMPWTPKLRHARLAGAPDLPLPAIGWALDRLKIDAGNQADHLAATVARLPGWAGHIRWRTEHADPEFATRAPASMADLVALLLFADIASDHVMSQDPDGPSDDVSAKLAEHLDIPLEKLGGRLAPVLAMDEADLGMIFQQAAETGLGNSLAKAMEAQLAVDPDDRARPDAQLVFCIDVRSEPMRRAVEAQGAYETIGYAGFFGLMIAVQQPNRNRVRQLPVLVAPQHDLALMPVPHADQKAQDYLASQARSDTAKSLFARLKTGSATAFSTAEAAGPSGAALMALRTLAPRAMRQFENQWKGDDSALAPSIERHGDCAGLSASERLAYAKALFGLTGMTPKSRLIVLVGHRGEAVNNPYASALDCGACAGHGGAPNARVMASILNDSDVRQALALPDDCWFLAGEHNTTTDTIALFDLHLAPAGHREDIAKLERNLAEAGKSAAASRAVNLNRPVDDLDLGAAHWGEVRPEWGLTGNAAFIVGARSLTRNIDLEGRAFLHDYDWHSDPEGETLATILTAPMVVAQWISCQYLFSTLDNERYGAGDKIVHNPVGRIGVVRGNGGDLAVGLPRQSLFHDNGCPAHIPQRLTVIIHAPPGHVDTVIESHAILQRLFGNGWVRLIVIDPETRRARRRLDNSEMDDPVLIDRSSGPEETNQ